MNIAQTEDLHFASYLLSTRKLRFQGCEPSGIGNQMLFRFDDPENAISDFYEEFLGGAEAPAIELFDSLKRLRRAMDTKSVHTTTRNGAQENDYANRVR